MQTVTQLSVSSGDGRRHLFPLLMLRLGRQILFGFILVWFAWEGGVPSSKTVKFAKLFSFSSRKQAVIEKETSLAFCYMEYFVYSEVLGLSHRNPQH